MAPRALERWKNEMPTEQEMLPRDKYTMFDRKEKTYRKGVHSESFIRFLFGLIAIGGGTGYEEDLVDMKEIE